MNARHTDRVRRAIKAADTVHQDTSVDPAETMASLKEIREHVDVLIESVASDLEMQGDDD